MAENYMQMLELGAKVTMDAMNRIDEATTKSFAMQQRNLEFEAEQTWKALQFGESQRMNSANIDNMKADNYMQARRMQIEQSILPLKIQSEHLNLETSRLRLKHARDEMDNNTFNELTGIYDDQVGYDILRTESVPMAQEYLGLKAEWKDRVAKGEQFDAKAFETQMGAIRNKYKDSVPGDEGWSADKQYLYESVSKKLGMSYEKKNPVVSKNRNALASSYYDMTDNQVGQFASQFGSLYEAEEYGQLGSGRTIFQTNKAKIKEYVDESSRMWNKLAVINPTDNPEEYNQTRTQAQAYDKLAKQYFDQNVKLQTDAASGKYGLHDVVAPTAPIAPKTGPKPEDHVAPPQSQMGIPPAKDEQGKTLHQGASEFVSKFKTNGEKSQEETELKGLDFKWFADNRVTTEMGKPAMASIKSTIEQNIEALGNVSERFTPERTGELFKLIGEDTAVPLSPFAVETLRKHNEWSHVPVYGGETDGGETSIQFGPKSKTSKHLDANRITDYSKIRELLNAIPKKAERDEVEKEIYAALITASLSKVVTSK